MENVTVIWNNLNKNDLDSIRNMEKNQRILERGKLLKIPLLCMLFRLNILNHFSSLIILITLFPTINISSTYFLLPMSAVHYSPHVYNWEL